MNWDDFEKELKVIDLKKANGVAGITLVVTAVSFNLLYFLLWPDHFDRNLFNIGGASIAGKIFRFFLPMLIILAGVVVHELLHGLTWSLFAKQGHRSIKYGILKKYGTPYCHCREPLQIRHYIIGALMPALILGFIPAVVALIIGSFSILLFGIFFIAAASGDFMVVRLLKNERGNDYVQDHPSEAGCYLFRERRGHT